VRRILGHRGDLKARPHLQPDIALGLGPQRLCEAHEHDQHGHRHRETVRARLW
jgi:hypothetical protein